MNLIRALIRVCRQRAGFTLAEVLIATAVIGVGLVGVSSGFVYAVAGVETGKQQTTATFLAEQRLEQVKGTTFDLVTVVTFPAEAYDTIPNAPRYRRTVTITNDPGGLVNSKLVQVTVFYQPVAGYAVLTTEREVRLSTLLVNRT